MAVPFNPVSAETRTSPAVDAATPNTDRGTTMPAALLGRCQFEECVSRGETTEVWTAATMEGEKCYVKFFHGLSEIDADARRDGLHLLESIRHPGLLPYNLVRDDGGRLIVVVPRKGLTLRERLVGLPGRRPARPCPRRIARRPQKHGPDA